MVTLSDGPDPEVNLPMTIVQVHNLVNPLTFTRLEIYPDIIYSSKP